MIIRFTSLFTLSTLLAACAASAPALTTEPPIPEAGVAEATVDPTTVEEAEPARRAPATPKDSRVMVDVDVEEDPFPSEAFAGVGLPGISGDGELIAMPQVEGIGDGLDISIVILRVGDASVERIFPIASSNVEDPDDDSRTGEGQRRARIAAREADQFLVQRGVLSIPALPRPGDQAVVGLPFLVWDETTLMLRDAGPRRIRWRGDPPEVPYIPLYTPDGEVYQDPCDYRRPTDVNGWMLPGGEHALLRFVTNPPGDECGIRLEYRVVPLD